MKCRLLRESEVLGDSYDSCYETKNRKHYKTRFQITRCLLNGIKQNLHISVTKKVKEYK